MTTALAPRPGGTSREYDVPTGPLWALRDSWTEAIRHLRVTPRNPELLIFATLQPIMFVLLFNFVFGAAIKIPGWDYTQYLMPGIFAQTVVFGTAFTGIGLADDLQKGFVDRLRSLPISQSAVLIGRTVSDLLRNAFTFVVMLGVAFAVGFRFDGGFVDGVLATLLLLAFGYSFSWIQALIGLSVKSVEAANSAGFLWMFPVTFVSSAFVNPAQMSPAFIRTIAQENPFTTVTNASRALYGGKPVGDLAVKSLLWALGITVVFATLAIRKFNRSASR